MIQVEKLLDSTSWLQTRLTTFRLTYPRFIHSQFMTHRVLSKNSSSSRAIPVAKLIDEARKNTVVPIWTGIKKGMQGGPTNEQQKQMAELIWRQIANRVCESAQSLAYTGIHKQNVNRLLEPFTHITVICTGTDWDNFFELREDHDAQPEIQELARGIRAELNRTPPVYLEPGDWHIPFGDRIDNSEVVRVCGMQPSLNNTNQGLTFTPVHLKISTARCARASYLTFDGNINVEKDLQLYEDLVSSKPQHLSPTEHQARVPYRYELKHFSSQYRFIGQDEEGIAQYSFEKGKYVSNLRGWVQHRKLIEL